MSGVGQHGRIFNALRAANVPEREASDATDAILSIKDADVSSLKQESKSLQADVAVIKSDLCVLKWQVGACMGLMVAVLALLLRLMFRMGAL